MIFLCEEEELYCRTEKMICDIAKQGSQHINYVPPYNEMSYCRLGMSMFIVVYK
jgi:hypothetical protein